MPYAFEMGLDSSPMISGSSRETRIARLTQPENEEIFIDPKPTHRYFIPLIWAAAAVILAAAAALAHAGCAPGMYTSVQAESGQTVYNAQCTACHSADLSGGSGPPLTGAKFASYLNFTKITGAQLESFIASQMPYNQHGSLKATDYLSVFAYILKVNNYPSGQVPVDPTTLACVNMLPYPGSK
jgi:S-disulfanyl-L-cysteine oxidoreductase SoxD